MNDDANFDDSSEEEKSIVDVTLQGVTTTTGHKVSQEKDVGSMNSQFTALLWEKTWDSIDKNIILLDYKQRCNTSNTPLAFSNLLFPRGSPPFNAVLYIINGELPLLKKDRVVSLMNGQKGKLIGYKFFPKELDFVVAEVRLLDATEDEAVINEWVDCVSQMLLCEMIEMVSRLTTKAYKVFKENNFGKIMKAMKNADDSTRYMLFGLLRFETTMDAKLSSLTTFLEKMKNGQETIFVTSDKNYAPCGPCRDAVFIEEEHIPTLMGWWSRLDALEMRVFVEAPMIVWLRELFAEKAWLRRVIDDSSVDCLWKLEVGEDGECNRWNLHVNAETEAAKAMFASKETNSDLASSLACVLLEHTAVLCGAIDAESFNKNVTPHINQLCNGDGRSNETMSHTLVGNHTISGACSRLHN